LGLILFRCWLLLFTLFAAHAACAQETVFDVPSADVLEEGKVYFELDGTANTSQSFYTYTPRMVIGFGHQIEAGVNFEGLSSPTLGQLAISPTIKWKLWNRDSAGWSFYIGDNVLFPIRDREYNAGNYFYAAFAKQWKSGTRITFGAYDFTAKVVANANRAGGQFTFEQPITKRLTFAAEWYTGNQADGYVNPGVNYKLTSKITLYGAYQIGNANVTKGNHQFLWEFGYNFN
jgi:hypothetical protein